MQDQPEPLTATTVGINPATPPSGPGCVECESSGGWWFHLRRCAACGHVGCCDSSPGQHATAHATTEGHPVVQSFEPGEDWFWDYPADRFHPHGPKLAPPHSRPSDQPAPGPRGRVPEDWKRRLH
ncbi:UBP-type zinc finger domain-containing protein [Micromonospora wenchangensis]|uniref:UBP-type zinc finger domain-containing protein n=1 Tax=Micromonospora wenchangensis TaxID=1185415 RepID=UPI003420F212